MNNAKCVLLTSRNNGLVVEIPNEFAAALGLVDGSLVDLTLVDGAILLRPLVDELTLDELLASISDNTQHDEVDLGPAQGNEVW